MFPVMHKHGSLMHEANQYVKLLLLARIIPAVTLQIASFIPCVLVLPVAGADTTIVCEEDIPEQCGEAG